MVRKRASRVVSVIALIICVAGHLYGADQHGADQPNVVVIISDDPVSYTHLTLPTKA